MSVLGRKSSPHSGQNFDLAEIRALHFGHIARASLGLEGVACVWMLTGGMVFLDEIESPAMKVINPIIANVAPAMVPS